MKRNYMMAPTLLVAICTALTAGCKPADSESASADNAPKSETPAKKTELTQDQRVTALANLARADLHDGKADEVVSECLMCSLRMKGKPEFATKYEGSELHFCSAGCKGHFDEDPAGVLLAADIEVK